MIIVLIDQLFKFIPASVRPVLISVFMGKLPIVIADVCRGVRTVCFIKQILIDRDKRDLEEILVIALFLQCALVVELVNLSIASFGNEPVVENLLRVLLKRLGHCSEPIRVEAHTDVRQAIHVADIGTNVQPIKT